MSIAGGGTHAAPLACHGYDINLTAFVGVPYLQSVVRTKRHAEAAPATGVLINQACYNRFNLYLTL